MEQRPKINKLMCMYMALVHVAAFFGCAVLWRQPDFPHKLAELIVWYLVTGLGITAGCHRLWSHRSFQAKPPTRFVLMLLASMCSQGSIYHWCRDHRTHHRHSDTCRDPHNSNRGFFYSHIGWLLLHKPSEVKSAGQQIDCSDLLDDWVSIMFPPVFAHLSLSSGDCRSCASTIASTLDGTSSAVSSYQVSTVRGGLSRFSTGFFSLVHYAMLLCYTQPGA